MAGYRIRAWTEAEFATGRDEWQRLLATSDADPLFMSWDWQWRWWAHHSQALGGRLHLLGVYCGSGALIGIAPFYSHGVRIRGLPESTRLELIGLAWRDDRAAFSEYLDIVAARGREDDVLAGVSEWLLAQDSWHDLVLAYTKEGSLAARLARSDLSSHFYWRESDTMESHCVALAGRFEDYLERLGSDVRRKLFNHRAKWQAVKVSSASPEQIGEYLELLRRLRAARWGEQVPGAEPLAFHIDFATSMGKAGCLQLTQLTVNDKPVSVMYDVRAGDTEYYLQSGFDGRGIQGLSPGYLHLGYMIEGACLAGMSHFDLLGGRGRHRNYKRDLLTRRSVLTCHHAVRAPWLKVLFAGWDAVRRRRERRLQEYA